MNRLSADLPACPFLQILKRRLAAKIRLSLVAQPAADRHSDGRLRDAGHLDANCLAAKIHLSRVAQPAADRRLDESR